MPMPVFCSLWLAQRVCLVIAWDFWALELGRLELSKCRMSYHSNYVLSKCVNTVHSQNMAVKTAFSNFEKCNNTC